MKIDPEHAEQYKMLREEITSLVAETRKLETAVPAAIAALYAWLVVHHVSRGIWFIGVPLVLLAGIRSLSLFFRIGCIATYLCRIEAKYFVEDPQLPGYERYFSEDTKPGIAPTAAFFWVVLLLVTLVVPFVIP